jgi:hypothetical protein
MKHRILFMCGVIAPLLFVFMAILGGAIRPDYSHIGDTVSELLSPGSPNRLLLSIIFTIYALLMALFGIGILWFIRRSEQSTPIGIIGASLFIAAGLINVAIATLYPQDPWGSPPTFAGEMHMNLSGVIGLLQLLSISLLGLWFRRAEIFPGFGAYSFLTAGAVILLVGFFLMMAGTPIMGLAERILILVGLLWTFVLALWMVSRRTYSDSHSL